MKTKLLLIGAAIVLASTPAFAHHSGAMFDANKEVTLQGTVKEFQFTNPHSWLLVSVPAATGKDIDWNFEAEGPSTLMRAGINRNTLKPGDKVTVTGRPLKDGRPAASLLEVKNAGGAVLYPHQGG